MNKITMSVFLFLFITPGLMSSVYSDNELLQGFVFIEGNTFMSGRGENVNYEVRVEDFEILDHPVTNAEYRIFVEETGHRVPLHWKDGKIPSGKEDYPVVYINRNDIDAFLDWISEKEGRIYRLPTTKEFEYAARGGLKGKKYPWGSGDPEEYANYDKNARREFNHWKKYLRPARWGKPNGYGLFGMAGNIWQFVVDNRDPATNRYKYRIEDISMIERAVMGGSWARMSEYLQCGYTLAQSPSITHPDLGFRPVREPEGSDWRIVNRQLVSISAGKGKVFLSWALVKGDKTSTGFNIYRTDDRSHEGFRVNEKPVKKGTTFIDEGLKSGVRYHYYVRPVDADGEEGIKSEWAGVTVREEPDVSMVEFKPIHKGGELEPVFGDLNGDGTPDVVIRLTNGNHEMSQDPGVPVQLEAFISYGRSLWRKDVCYHDHCYGSAHNVPFNVWDMDGDGRAEVITRLQMEDSVFVAILNGMTGEVKCKTPWPEMVSDFTRSSTRIHLSIAYLDGKTPSVITQTGLYENEVFVAFDNKLNELWRFESFGATNGSGGHKIEVADINGDGKQEVFDGTTCLSSDGTMRWSIYKQHPDKIAIRDFLLDRPGLEVFYAVETSVHAGAYMVDANTGEIIWKINREEDPRWTHSHYGMTSDVWDGSEGIECFASPDKSTNSKMFMFTADGKVLTETFPLIYKPCEWDGDETRELLSDQGHKIGNFNGQEVIDIPDIQPNPVPGSELLMVADIYGDFRDELVLQTETEDGDLSISVITATTPADSRFLRATESLDYRLWLARNLGGGYRSVYENPTLKP